MIFLELFLTFFKIGLFTFGGGYAMIPMIRQDVVDAKHWLTSAEVNEFIGIAESTPGPFAINIATFVGMNEGGVLGALCSTLGVVMPSFIIILIIAKLYSKMKKSNNFVFDTALSSVRPIIVGLIGVAFIDIFAGTCLGGVDVANSATYVNIQNTDFIAIGIAVLMFILTKTVKKFSPIMVVISSACLGMLCYGIESII